MNIPIIVVCYNNYKYVNHTLTQIKQINTEYYKNIIILNNSSTCVDTIEFLKTVDVKVINNNNNGPWINSYTNAHIYNTLPDKFILTDPDLELNENIPSNFVEILSDLSDKYKTSKIGMALSITDFEKMYDGAYALSKNIYEHEIQFWMNKIEDSSYELYYADIDTTFCLINKNHNENSRIRVAGNFTAKHLPWYKDNKIYNVYNNYMANINTTSISTISKIIVPYIERKYIKVNKNGELFLIENDANNQNLAFWRDIYRDWEADTFSVLDKYLAKNKIFIDIGGWIGTMAMYGSRKSKHVYSIEADKKSHDDMSKNLKINCIDNYTAINKVIYNIDNIQLKFGKNKFLPNSKMNDSTSQIYHDGESSSEYYLAETITLESIIEKYQIDPKEVGIIKVDIEGGEENILHELNRVNKKYEIPIYVSFHYSWWNDSNLDRFDFLSSLQKDNIRAHPFTSFIL
jgi:FkbM family methyltransferase